MRVIPLVESLQAAARLSRGTTMKNLMRQLSDLTIGTLIAMIQMRRAHRLERTLS